MPNLASQEQCSGCAACANVCPKNAIKMIADKEGFLQPVVEKSACIGCGLCERTCPALSSELPWGSSEPKVFAGWHLEDRGICSSGGAFSAFARKILENDGVVFGVVFDSDFNCKHVEIDDLAGLAKLRGSKYVQSDVGETFKSARDYLKNGRRVLFSGTSCQIAGLRSFLKKDYENLLTVDLACHGVPSNKVFKSYLAKLQKGDTSLESLKGFSFRLPNGWGKTSRVLLKNETWKTLYDIEALYMSAFDKSALFRKSCYSCRYTKIPRIGDISLADFWGLGQMGVPFKHDVMQGVSLILANTDKGIRAVEDLGDETFVEERSLKEALAKNHNLRAPSEKFENRDDVIKDFLDQNVSLAEIDKKYRLIDHSLKARIKTWSSKMGIFDIAKRVYNKVKSV